MRRLLAVTLASLAALGGVAFAMRATWVPGTQAPFTLTVDPARQSAVRGGAASFSVTVAPDRRFTGAAKLRVAGLPKGVRPRWEFADGTGGGAVPPTETGAVLTLRVSTRAPLGARRVRVFATAGGTTRSRTMTLVVTPRGSRRFVLNVSPARQSVLQGATATYAVRVLHAAGFRTAVSLRVLRPPRGARATWTHGALTIEPRADQRPGSHRIVLVGTGRVGGRLVRRYAVVVLTVVRARSFSIAGDLATLMYPGSRSPLDLVLTNPYPFDIAVTSLHVRAGAHTTNPGCSGEANYAVTQYSGRYPLKLPPGSTRLSALVPDASRWPQISMHNLPVNQDACRHAVVALDYNGEATQ